MKNKTAAKITGYSIIIMALLAAFAFGYAYPKICDLTDKSLTVTKNSNFNCSCFWGRLHCLKIKGTHVMLRSKVKNSSAEAYLSILLYLFFQVKKILRSGVYFSLIRCRKFPAISS